jgi:transcriptional regulator with XRE-family HTH domain
MSDQSASYWMAVARMGFEEDFNRLFDKLNITRAELAARLEVTPAYISKVLNGTAGNYKLETMTKWARAIGAILQIRLISEDGEVVRVVDYETARVLDATREDTARQESIVSADETETLATLLTFRRVAGVTTGSFSAEIDRNLRHG